MSKQFDDHRRRLQMVWSRKDFDDLAAHAAEAIALTKPPVLDACGQCERFGGERVGCNCLTEYRRAQQLGPYTPREHFADSVFNVCRRAQVGDPAAAPQRDQLAPVVDINTRRRVR